MSTENATILTNSDRWPLMIDPQVTDLPRKVQQWLECCWCVPSPQLQGVKWIKQKYGEALIVVRLGQKGAMDTIEQGVTSGATVLLENIDENVDPVLDPLLGRNLIRKGRQVPWLCRWLAEETPPCNRVGEAQCDQSPRSLPSPIGKCLDSRSCRVLPPVISFVNVLVRFMIIWPFLEQSKWGIVKWSTTLRSVLSFIRN